ncbi:MAG: KGK domain-containing protein [Synechococcales bacterium]|nr:KGK domain-containing protein [Synechococcales bacterium]
MNNDRFEPLQPSDVISSTEEWFMPHTTYTLEEFCQEGRERINFDGDYPEEDWVIQEMDCRVLQADKPGWRSGKMRVRVQVVVDFAPDQDKEDSEKPDLTVSSTSLDTIRKIVN